MLNIQDLLTTNTTVTRKKQTKRSEEARAKMSLAAKTRDPEAVKKHMAALGKKPKKMTEKRLANLRRQQQTLSTREDNRRGGLKAMSKPENRRKRMRKWKAFVNLTDEEFEERMKILDKKFEERTRQQEENRDS